MKLLCVAVAVGLTVISCAPGGGETALREGKKLLNSPDPADWNKALQQFQKSIEIEVRARNQMAIAYRKIALKKLDRAKAAVTPEQFDAVLQARLKTKLGEAFTTIHLFHDAVSNLQAAVRITPNVKYLHYNLGICYSQLSRSTVQRWERNQFLDLAAAAYTRALGLDQNYQRARYGLAIVEMNKANYTRAAALLNELIKAEPENQRAYYALARVYYEDKRYNLASGTYRLLLELLPSGSTRAQKVRENLKKIRLMQASGQ